MNTETVVDCFTSFYMEKDQSAVCGIVLVAGDEKKIHFNHKPGGDYLNGLLELVYGTIRFLHQNLKGQTLLLDVHVHHKNNNLKIALNKAIKAADTARGYKGVARDNIIKHTLIRRDYHKPACYERMVAVAKILIEFNDPAYCVTVTTCNDSKSPDQLAVYTACQGAWNDAKIAMVAGTAQSVA